MELEAKGKEEQNARECPACKFPLENAQENCPRCGWSKANALAFWRVVGWGMLISVIVMILCILALPLIVPDMPR
jgi:uncharacterized paraquat-inducible protein A